MKRLFNSIFYVFGKLQQTDSNAINYDTTNTCG